MASRQIFTWNCWALLYPTNLAIRLGSTTVHRRTSVLGCVASAPSATWTASNSGSAGQRGMAGWGDGGCHGTRPGDFKSEPTVLLPIYKGKAEWRTFLLQFERLAQRFGWGSDEKLDRLVSCLCQEALDHFAALPTEVQRDLHLMTSSFTRRFDDH